ncbi:hypothetical protein I317_00283 [Kwoniella heveanensis CBS 569]|uniref:Uncharacterized protein n=1 Tax=Kwoniella heveanensis BCC8398 TaxID=1296120 RepID=A0A1B9GNC4_9TREE|nr:hypothetical protein I316_05698 [Kwoniella heveanensis BCC8398]OCF45795.1 hypothetical protein I317_00283 [Kwoniella heveanensis CBS 569]
MPIAFPRPSETPQSPVGSSTSLPSYPSSIDSDDASSDVSSTETDTEDGDLDSEAAIHAMIQEEWEESLRQMEVVLSIVIMPFFGKWFGRQWSYWAWARYQRLGGLGRPFFGLSA